MLNPCLVDDSSNCLAEPIRRDRSSVVTDEETQTEEIETKQTDEQTMTDGTDKSGSIILLYLVCIYP